MAALLSLPSEVLHGILKWTDPNDLVLTLPLCCKALHTFIANDTVLHRDLYLLHLDDPPSRRQGASLDWKKELHDFVRLRTILECPSDKNKQAELKFIENSISRMLQNGSHTKSCPSRNVRILSKFFSTWQNREAILCASNLFERLRPMTHETPGHNLRYSTQQLSAKLHCLYGVPVDTIKSISNPYNTRRTSRTLRSYPFAASKVYDLRNYTDKTQWGPFLEDGSQGVDWERMEAIMCVLGNNLRMFSNHTGAYKTIWTKGFEGVVKGSYISTRERAESTELDTQDPYNITGTYMRIVCFLDFHELFHYNFGAAQPAPGDPRPPLDTTEAIRTIAMELKVTKIEPPGPDDGQALPVVHFEGTSRSMHEPWDTNAVGNIKGSVRLTKEGEVRWTTFSLYHGEERWRSEGVQVGGVQSARGVYGNWFDKDYDVHGPAGPTAFWKINDTTDRAEGFDEMEGLELPGHNDDGEDDDDEDDEGEDEDEDEDEESDGEISLSRILGLEGGVYEGGGHGYGGGNGAEDEERSEQEGRSEEGIEMDLEFDIGSLNTINLPPDVATLMSFIADIHNNSIIDRDTAFAVVTGSGSGSGYALRSGSGNGNGNGIYPGLAAHTHSFAGGSVNENSTGNGSLLSGNQPVPGGVYGNGHDLTHSSENENENENEEQSEEERV